MTFNVEYFFSVFPQLIPYIPVTLVIAVVSMLFAICLGLAIALIRNLNIKIVNYALALFISWFRSMPSVVLMFIIYYGMPQLFPIMKGIPAIIICIIGFSFKYSAYLAEIFRASLAAVDHGQKEAGLTVKLNIIQIYIHIILPQAFVNALPNMGNMFVSLLKDSSIAFFIGVEEILSVGKMLTVEFALYLETYLAVSIIYWLLVVIYSYCQKILETKLNNPYAR